MFWKLFQIAVFFAVIASDIEYDWGHGTSKLAVGVVAAGAAFLATVIISEAFLLLRRRKTLLLGRN